MRAITPMKRQRWWQPARDTGREGFTSQWRSELIRLEPKNETIWREKYESIMMQKEEILILSCPTVKLSMTIPALYQLCATDAAMRLESGVKGCDTRSKTHSKISYWIPFRAFIFFFIPDRAAMDCQCSKRIFRKAAYSWNEQQKLKSRTFLFPEEFMKSIEMNMIVRKRW